MELPHFRIPGPPAPARPLVEGSGFDVTKRIVRPDGELRQVRSVGFPVIDDGKLKTVVGEELPGRHAFADAISEILEGSKTHEYRREGSYFMNRRGFFQLLCATGAAARSTLTKRIKSVFGAV